MSLMEDIEEAWPESILNGIRMMTTTFAFVASVPGMLELQVWGLTEDKILPTMMFIHIYVYFSNSMIRNLSYRNAV